MPFIGKSPTAGFASIVKDDLTPNGSTTAFTLSKQVANVNDIAVFVGNVRQEPTDAYTVNGTTLTMSEAVASGLNFYVLHIAGTVESSVVPADNTISTGKLQANSITEAKLADINFAGNTLTDTSNSGSITLDFATNQNFVLTLTGNITLVNPTTEAVGQTGVIVFIQDGSGSRTVSLGTDYETAGAAGITLSTTASTTDVVPYIVAASGRILLGTPQLAFA